jgi:hypothetical protein
MHPQLLAQCAVLLQWQQCVACVELKLKQSTHGGAAAGAVMHPQLFRVAFLLCVCSSGTVSDKIH